jgi:hypothetical protein
MYASSRLTMKVISTVMGTEDNFPIGYYLIIMMEGSTTLWTEMPVGLTNEGCSVLVHVNFLSS